MKLSSSFCRTKKKHGGVEIFVKSILNVTLLKHVIDLSCESDFEIAVTILEECSIIIMSFYRAPNSNWHNFFDRFEKSLNLCCNKTYNYYNRLFYYSFWFNNDFEKQFINLISMYGLIITNHKPTRITKHNSTCLDNILINENINYKFANFDPVLSDHSALM